MIDLFKKTLLMGIGAASLTADHVKAFVDDLEKQGKITREEAERLAGDLAAKTSEHVKVLASQLEEEGKLTREEIEKFAVEMAAKTSEQLKTLVEELQKKGKISSEEAINLAKEAVSKTESVRHEFEERFTAFVADLVKKLNLVSRSEYDALHARLTALEEKIADFMKGAEKPD